MPAFDDLAEYAQHPRTTDLALSPDGHRLVACVQGPEPDEPKLVSALWEIPLDGGEPFRLTRSTKNENSPKFQQDGSLLFTTTRPDPDVDGEDAALWSLPPVGEARPVATRAGGLRGPAVAATGAYVVTGSLLQGSTEDDDADRRSDRSKRKIGAILHTGMPIRFWDHELDEDQPHLLFADSTAGEDLRDLTPEATFELTEAQYSITADATTVATTWRSRGRRGRMRQAIALINTTTGTRTLLEPENLRYGDPVIAPDGSIVAALGKNFATFENPVREDVLFVPTDGSAPIQAELGDLWPHEYTWLPDSSALLVTGDLHGRGAVVLVDPATGAITRRLAADAAYSTLRITPDGTAVYALRTAIDAPAAPVRLDLASTDQTPTFLPDPAPIPALPGTLTELDIPLEGGGTVHAWLCQPFGHEPAPVITWIHGGPMVSYNRWNWRANPWVAVARGWAVLMPDPALSTGYGQGLLERAWPYRAEVVWREVETALDHVLTLPSLDATRTVLLGASFGGFMTNWIAGHTDRFRAIVTHAGLWALDQQHATTDAADYKTGIFGHLADHPDWYAANSPHHFADRIRTPMLIVHGNRDYRVPVSEALRLWWDLVHGWDGEPEEFPHRFLQFTNENHWILTPGNVEVWYENVLGFCATHIRAGAELPV